MAPIRIYIVDDYPLVRHGLAMLISGEPDMVVCGEAGDADHAFEEIKRLLPDIVIVDIALQGLSGLSLIKNLRAFSPAIGIIALSMHEEKVYGLRALKAGAGGYVCKADPSEHVLEAIRRVRTGGVFVGNELAGQLLGRIRMGMTDPEATPTSQLSDRELQIVDLIGRGLTTREVASRLHLSVKTVETHRAHIKTKLQFGNATQLVQFCVRWVQENERPSEAPRPQSAGPGENPPRG
jgi:DNA-binding NarL/FixJ family response regulator